MLCKELVLCAWPVCAAQASVSRSALGDGLLPEQLRPGLIVKDDPKEDQLEIGSKSGLGCGGRYQTMPSWEGLG